ncbi:MAG TPA: Fur family transcriptional regulator [Candidatus Limnocylindria bacterium]
MTDTTAARLTAAGERVTQQRLVVAETLARAGRQLTAGELYERVRDAQPSLGRATVFRTVERLVEAGVARRLELDRHVYAYVACQPEHHHHLSCTSCGRVEEIPELWVQSIARRATEDLGFEIDDARLDFYGRCSACRAAS